MTTAIDDGVNPHDALRSLTTDAGPSWRALGACWAIARVSGAPLGPALEALAEALSDISRTKRQITAALAGPKATMRLVMALPVIGIIGGELGGQSSLAFLVGTGLGASVLALGTAMMLGAWWWLRLLAERAKPDPAALGLEMDLFAIATGGGALPEWTAAAQTLPNPEIPEQLSQKFLEGRMTQAYGVKETFKGHLEDYHGGYDFVLKGGTKAPVGSPINGVVVSAGMNKAYGNSVIIKDAQGRTHRISHLSSINVKPGQEVFTETILGNQGQYR
jgi:hypothetical protein